MENKNNRPPIETLACPYKDCHLHATTAAGNLTVRKIYGKGQIRYLRCRACAREFSERKNTALFNSKIAEKKAVSVGEHLAEGLSTKAISRLLRVSPEAVRRLRRNLGEHARDFHDQRVQDLKATSVQMDERYGYAGSKKQPLWEATAIEPRSRLLVDFVVGRRDEALIRKLMEATRKRLGSPKDLVLMSDGHSSYESLFPSIFLRALPSGTQGSKGTLSEGEISYQQKPRPSAGD